LAPKITKLAFGFEILAPKILYKKRAHMMLMKLTPWGRQQKMIYHTNDVIAWKRLKKEISFVYLKAFTILKKNIFSNY